MPRRRLRKITSPARSESTSRLLVDADSPDGLADKANRRRGRRRESPTQDRRDKTKRLDNIERRLRTRTRPERTNQDRPEEEGAESNATVRPRAESTSKTEAVYQRWRNGVLRGNISAEPREPVTVTPIHLPEVLRIFERKKKKPPPPPKINRTKTWFKAQVNVAKDLKSRRLRRSLRRADKDLDMESIKTAFDSMRTT